MADDHFFGVARKNQRTGIQAIVNNDIVETRNDTAELEQSPETSASVPLVIKLWLCQIIMNSPAVRPGEGRHYLLNGQLQGQQPERIGRCPAGRPLLSSDSVPR
jgi:hypothetical protein